MKKTLLLSLLLAAGIPLHANAAISVAIDIAPPPLPVYAQPVIPSAGYIWTPGYWRWNPDDGDYFWVPGTWIAPPYVGALWTPGYWGWGGGGYAWHGGYWGPHVGFYGGVNYGFGYVGTGYAGGRWDGGVFAYNRSVNNINPSIVHNVYNTTVVENNTHVSYNGGQGGIAARPTPQEQAAMHEQHVQPTPLQRQHEQVAMRSPEQRASFNHGSPTTVATPQPRAFAAANGGGGHPGPRAPAQMHANAGPPNAGPPHGHEGGSAPHGGGAPHGGPEHAGGAQRHEAPPERHENAR